MGYMFVLGSCYGCGKMFSFNPYLVPSVKGEPVCKTCVEIVNGKKQEAKMPEFRIPIGAYEPIKED